METAKRIAVWHCEQMDEQTDHEDGDALSIILGEILAHGNIRLKAIGLFFAAGLNRGNKWNTERKAAVATGFTPAAINAEKTAWIEMLRLARNEHCKTDSAREKYKSNGLNNHWRKGFSKTTKPSTTSC